MDKRYERLVSRFMVELFMVNVVIFSTDIRRKSRKRLFGGYLLNLFFCCVYCKGERVEVREGGILVCKRCDFVLEKSFRCVT